MDPPCAAAHKYHLAQGMVLKAHDFKRNRYVVFRQIKNKSTNMVSGVIAQFLREIALFIWRVPKFQHLWNKKATTAGTLNPLHLWVYKKYGAAKRLPGKYNGK